MQLTDNSANSTDLTLENRMVKELIAIATGIFLTHLDWSSLVLTKLYFIQIHLIRDELKN